MGWFENVRECLRNVLGFVGDIWGCLRDDSDCFENCWELLGGRLGMLRDVWGYIWEF